MGQCNRLSSLIRSLATAIVLTLVLAGCQSEDDNILSSSRSDDSAPSEPEASVPPPEDEGDGENEDEDDGDQDDGDQDDADDEPENNPPAALTATPGDREIEVSWESVPDASGYRLYHTAEPDFDPDNYAAYRDGERLDNVSSPLTLENLTNHRYHFIQVAALVDGTEVSLGDELAVAPRGLQAGAREVRMLELMNRARLDPEAEASRLGINLNDGLDPEDSLSPDPRPPLAFNNALMVASREHSQWMLDTDTFSHIGEGGSSLTDRIDASDYPLERPWAVGENLAWGGVTGSNLNLDAYIDTHHEGLFKSPGHRRNILGDYRELGVGQVKGHFRSNGDQYLVSMLTNKLARASDRYFLTGVVHNGGGNAPLYTVGAGRDDVFIRVDDYYYQPTESGAFTIPLTPGTHQLEVSGDRISQTLSHSFAVNDENVKVDVVFSGSGTATLQTW